LAPTGKNWFQVVSSEKCIYFEAILPVAIIVDSLKTETSFAVAEKNKLSFQVNIKVCTDSDTTTMLGFPAYKFQRQTTELSKNLPVNQLASNQKIAMSLGN